MSGTPEQLQHQTIAFWQPLSDRRLTREDARQIAENLSGFFNLLRVWSVGNDIKDRSVKEENVESSKKITAT
jgi:hypothetical protein